MNLQFQKTGKPAQQNPTPESVLPVSESPPSIRVKFPKRTPWVSYSLLAFTVLVYLGQILSQTLLGFDLPANVGMKINEAIMFGQHWRFLTSMFLHGSVLHIGFNMYALYLLGPQIEQYFGHWQFFLLYLLSGFGGAVFSFALTENPSLGASTAIFGLLGAQGVFAYNNQRVFGLQARKAIRSIVNIALINFLIGLMPGIDNWAHLGGLLGGLMITYYGGPIYVLVGSLPELDAINQRKNSKFILASAGTAAIFALLAAAIIKLPINL